MRILVPLLVAGALLAGPLGLAGCQSCVTDSSEPTEGHAKNMPSGSVRYRPHFGLPVSRMPIRDASDDE